MVSSGYERCGGSGGCHHELAPAFLKIELTAPMSQCVVEDCEWCGGSGRVSVTIGSDYSKVPCMKCMGIGFRERYDPRLDSGSAA